jgi:hypothetical protein
MPKYFYGGSNAALSAGTDLVTIIAPSAGRFRIVDAWASGQDTVSVANELSISRSSGGTSGSAAQTAVKAIADSPSAASTNFTAWSVQPTEGNRIHRLGVNSNGAVFRFPIIPGEESEWRASDQLSLRCVSGTGHVSWGLCLEEM